MQQTKFKPLPSHGSYFQLYSCKASAMKLRKTSPWVTKEYGVATIPTSVFYKQGQDNKVLRFCFSKMRVMLEEAANRLMNLTFKR
jgi:methionine aminotransferase